MYRQINVHESNRRFQRILWRFSEDDPLMIFNLNTVTYGLAPSAYQALRCLRQLSADEGETYPLVCSFPEKNICVDDAFFGADTIEESVSLAKAFYDFLMVGGFPLRKWAANQPSLLEHLPVEWLAEKPAEDSLTSQNHPLLGLIWNPSNDEFSFSTEFPELNHIVTKRQVLSILAKLYDLLGMLSPLTIRSTYFFKNLWSCQFLK